MSSKGRSHSGDVLHRAARLAVLVLIVRKEGIARYNTATLAAAWGVSRRSIQRDMLVVETIEQAMADLGY